MQDLSAEDLGLPFDPEVVNDWIQNVAESSPLLGDPQGTAAARDLVTVKKYIYRMWRSQARSSVTLKVLLLPVTW